jgi:hypothetical protein
VKKSILWVWLTSATGFLLSFPLIPSVDAASARSDFSLNPNNWFGSLTPLIYGIAPGSQNSWVYFIGAFQVIIFTAGFILMFRASRITKVAYHLTLFIGSVFSSWVIRDSLMFSLIVFSIGIMIANSTIKSHREKLLLGLSLVLLVIALSIRPFFSIAFIFIILTLFHKIKFRKMLSFFLIVVFAFAPYSLDFGLSRMLNQGETFPSQQVIIFDLSQMACWSSNENLRVRASNALEPIVNSNSVHGLCENLRPFNWQFLVSGDQTDESGALRRLSEGDLVIYRKLVAEYALISVSRPDEFMKIKLRNLNELLFVNGQLDGIEKSKSLISFPIRILDKLHLFSWVILLPLIIFLMRSKSALDLRSKAPLDGFGLALVRSGFLTIPLIAVFYVGAIGRYTLISSFLLVFGLIKIYSSKTTS